MIWRPVRRERERTRGRWAGVTRRRNVAPPTSKLHEQILSNDSLETQVQNDTSPFPPTFREQVSRRTVPLLTGARAVSLRRLCMLIAAQHFSTHILPTPERLEHIEKQAKLKKVAWRMYTDALWWNETNKDLLKHLPSTIMDELFDLLCLYAPWALTKDVLVTYFLPVVGTAKQPARPRKRIFLPASLPVFSQDTKCAPLMLATLAGSLALAADPKAVTAHIQAIDVHGLTRLPGASISRLLKAPTVPQAWQLERVTLPGCLAVNDATVNAIIQVSGMTLVHLDVTLTSATAASITALGVACPRLRVLKLAWCEQLSDDNVAHAVSDAIAKCGAASDPRIPFQNLEELDMSHTLVGDVGLSSLLRLCGTHLTSLDVSYTHVGESGTFDVLAIGLGVGSMSDRRPVASRLEHIGLAGLCVHASALVEFMHKWLSFPTEQGPSPSLRSVNLDDMVEYVRRQPSSLQGRQGLSGDALHVLAEMFVYAHRQHAHVFDVIKISGEKRSSCMRSHWALPTQYMRPFGMRKLSDIMHMLMTCTKRLSLQGLDLGSLGEDAAPLRITPVMELSLQNTSLDDAGLMRLAAWTGHLTSAFFDHTHITRTCSY